VNAPFKDVPSALAEAKLMTDDEYYPSLMPKNIRPALWRLKDLEPRLDALLKDPLKRADRRFLSLVNGDTPAENPGVLPGLFCEARAIPWSRGRASTGKRATPSSARRGRITSTSTTAPRSRCST
jgi:hypothetical protein